MDAAPADWDADWAWTDDTDRTQVRALPIGMAQDDHEHVGWRFIFDPALCRGRSRLDRQGFCINRRWAPRFLTNTVPVASMAADVSMLTSAFSLTFSEAGYGQAVADRCRSYGDIACDALDCGGGD